MGEGWSSSTSILHITYISCLDLDHAREIKVITFPQLCCTVSDSMSKREYQVNFYCHLTAAPGTNLKSQKVNIMPICFLKGGRGGGGY